MAGAEAVSCVPLTEFVDDTDPFRWTTELTNNPGPFTVSVSGPPPTVAEFGFKPLMIGVGGAIMTVSVPAGLAITPIGRPTKPTVAVTALMAELKVLM